MADVTRDKLIFFLKVNHRLAIACAEAPPEPGAHPSVREAQTQLVTDLRTYIDWLEDDDNNPRVLKDKIRDLEDTISKHKKGG